VQPASDFVVVVLSADGKHQHHPARVDRFEHVKGTDRVSGRVVVDGRSFDIESATPLGHLLMTGQVNGVAFSAQVEHGSAAKPLALRVTQLGITTEALVLSSQAAAMLALMPHKAPPDTSKLLLSPMPGLLTDVLVKPGQTVLAGEKLAVIEAMKMENILTASRDGVVKELLANRGESVAVDQPILSFS
jgi:propionyl-CoA carboxylase alpha chain